MLFVVQFLTVIWTQSLASQAVQKAPYVGVPAIVNFSRADYQAGTQNWFIGQNAQGLMYFGNNKGLLTYDGSSWQLTALPNRTILRSFCFDGHYRIFAGGQSEFGYFQYNAEGTLAYTSLAKWVPEEFSDFEDVWKVFLRDDSVYFCTERAVYVWDGTEMRVLEAASGRFENFFETQHGLYFQDKTQGLYACEGLALKPIEESAVIQSERVVSILPYTGDSMLVVTASSGIFVWVGGDMYFWEVPLSQFAMEHQAYCGLQLKDGNYAVGSSQNGLALGNASGVVWSHIHLANGLGNNTVLSLFQDAQHNIWMGLDNGIAYASMRSPFSLIGAESGIKGTGYASLIQDGYLYLGTNQGLYVTPWIEGGNGEPLQFEPMKGGVGQIWNINTLSHSTVVSQHKGASYLNGRSLVPFSQVQGAWKFLELNSFPGYAIEGTYNGLILYQNSPDRPEEWNGIKKLEGFNESSRVLEEDANGDIWVSHAYKGVYRIRLAEDAMSIANITPYTTEDVLPAPLFLNVSKIRNELIFTAPVGIFYFDNESESFKIHEEFKEIFGAGRNVHRLIEDQLGNIWFSIDNEFGVLRVDERGVFNKLETAYFNQVQEWLVDGFEHVYAYDKRNVFIGTEKGFIHFDPEAIPDVEFPFDLLIRKVMLTTAGDSVVFASGYADRSSTKAEFSHRLNDFKFEYTAPYFEENSQLVFRYKLDGFDKDWSQWSDRTEKEYTNLPHGAYSFAVQARNAYGTQSKQATYDFVVLPPWYATTLAKLFFVLLAIAAVAFLFLIISRREKKKTEVFKREQSQKMAAKEAEFIEEVKKSEEAVVMLRNEKLEADVNHKTSQLASATMHLVQKSETLTKLKSELVKIQEEAPADLKRKLRQISRAIDEDIQLDNNWEQFELYFDQVHENFFKRLRQKFPQLTPKDQKLCAYLRMNLTTKEIAPLLNISVRGVEISRYRVRKKLGIESDVNLVEFIMDV